jgi:hypothetical protein
MRQTAARLWPRGLSPTWLVPLTALVLLSVTGPARRFDLPREFVPVAFAAPVALAGVAWLMVVRRKRVLWLAVGALAGVGLAAFVIVDPTHLLPPIWDEPRRLEIVLSAVSVVAIGAWLGRRRAGPPRPLDMLIGLVLVGMVAIDLNVVNTVYQRDLNLYLDAGRDFLGGGPVYAQQPLLVAPLDQTELPFVYPPATLPFFAALSVLPQPLVAVAWLVLQCAAALIAIRAIGVPWRWVGLLVLWPPFVQGIWVGNVAIWMVVLFAFVPIRPFLVALLPVFKFQTGLAGLWLIRERRWRSLIASILLVGGLVLATLPLVGVNLWIDWYHGIVAFEQSTINVPGIRGLAISRSIGQIAAVGMTVAIVVLSLRLKPRASLASLGLASVTVAPSLYLHGLTLALPGLLAFRAWVFWLAMLVAVVPGVQGYLWLVIVITSVASVVPLLRHDGRSVEAAWQPLGVTDGPWAGVPSAPANPIADLAP